MVWTGAVGNSGSGIQDPRCHLGQSRAEARDPLLQQSDNQREGYEWLHTPPQESYRGVLEPVIEW